MDLKEFIETEKINEDLFNKYNTSKKANRLIAKLYKRKGDLEVKVKTIGKKEDKDLLRALNRSIPVIEKFRDYFIKLEKKLEDTDDKERELLIQAKYDDIKALFVEELYKIMEHVQYRTAIFVGSLIAWIIFLMATPFTNWMLIPTFLSLKNINKNKKRITNRYFSKEMNKLLAELEAKKRKQYRSYKEVGIEF